MKNLLVLVLLVVPLCSARSLEGRESDTCIADYLKSKQLISNEYGSKNPVSSLCAVIIQVTKQKIMESIEENLEEDVRMRNESACMVKFMQEADFAERMLVIYFLENSDNQANEEVQREIKKAQKVGNEVTLTALISCEADEKVNEAFEELFKDKSSSEEELDDKEDYCIRRHILDHNLINTEHFKLVVNPKNLDTSEIDCQVLYEKSLKDAEDELVKALAEDSSEEQSENSMEDSTIEQCLLKVIRKHHFIDQMFQYDYIKEFDLTPAKKEELRVQFVKIMTELSKKSVECVI
jgi:ribosome-associated toxin RatA of RatAB toxin-antitoxin module